MNLKSYSTLSVYDIDLSVPGKTTIEINTDATGTAKRTVTDAYYMDDGRHFDFMAMSEGLCIIEPAVHGDANATIKGHIFQFAKVSRPVHNPT